MARPAGRVHDAGVNTAAMNALSRRRFLKISAATVVAAGAAGPAARALAAAATPAGPARRGAHHPDLLRYLLLEVRSGRQCP